jgi:pimeloyl-ACP methyl ester carboxylesterase
MPFPYPGETLELNEMTRAPADGSFVSLPDGVTHYELGGAETGPAVVLVHGFSVPYYIFDPTFDFLTQAGLRVLRYDLLGRGWSDRPNVAYSMDLFTRQLRDLLDALHIPSPVSLLGLSMGGPITAAFSVRHPERVARNVLIDPAGTHPVELGWRKAGNLPLVGELTLGLFGGEQMVKNAVADFFDPRLVERFQEKYRVQMRFAGFRRAILSTMRNGMLGEFSATYRQLGSLDKPLLLLWGRDDAAVPFAHSADLLKLLPQAEFHALDGCGHIPHYERPEAVNPLLLEFLTRRAPSSG